MMAAAHDRTSNTPGIKNAASFSMAALITIRKSPNVRIQMGNVMIFSRRPRVELINPITAAAISAPPNPLMRNPGTKYATISSDTALTSHRMSNLIALAFSGSDYLRKAAACGDDDLAQDSQDLRLEPG